MFLCVVNHQNREKLKSREQADDGRKCRCRTRCEHDNTTEAHQPTIATASTQNEIDLLQIQTLPSLALYLAAR
jgi:hypothetical protein